MAEKVTKARVHVIKRESSWAVKKQGNSKASKLYDTKEAAVDGAKKYKTQGHDLVVHRKDGTIEKWEKARNPRK